MIYRCTEPPPRFRRIESSELSFTFMFSLPHYLRISGSWDIQLG